MATTTTPQPRTEPHKDGFIAFFPAGREHRDALVELGARWSPSEKMWYGIAGTEQELEAKYGTYLSGNAHQQSAQQGSRVELHVPYADKEAAKSAGAQWDSEKKTWYVEGDAAADSSKYSQWLTPPPAKEKSESKATTGNTRLDIFVHYDDREAAKELGAQWDSEKKTWFALGDSEKQLRERFANYLDPKALERKSQKASTEGRDPVDEFTRELQKLGLKVDRAIMDGTLRRVAVEGGKPGQTDGSYKGYLDQNPAGYGQNWKTGGKTNWNFGANLTNEQRDEWRQQVDTQKKADAERTEELRVVARQQLVTDLQTMVPVEESHPWLQSKKIGHLVGDSVQLLVNKDAPNADIAIQLYNQSGQLQTAQYIKLGQDGKSYYKGYTKDLPSGGASVVVWKGNKDKCTLDDLVRAKYEHEGRQTLIVCEGLSTAVAIAAATELPVVAAMQANNLSTVVQQIKDLGIRSDIFIAGDDDKHLSEQQPPKKNAGRVYATEAAKLANEPGETIGATIFPRFQNSKASSDFTDWNDIHRIANNPEESIKKQFDNAMAFYRKRFLEEHGQEKTNGNSQAQQGQEQEKQQATAAAKKEPKKKTQSKKRAKTATVSR